MSKVYYLSNLSLDTLDQLSLGELYVLELNFPSTFTDGVPLFLQGYPFSYDVNNAAYCI